MNPESYSISPRIMYSYDRGLNKSWNIPQYKTPKIYQDPRLQAQKRKWASQQKGKKSDRYQTKRGFYLDYQLKVAKSIPGSDAHQQQSPWSFKKLEQKSKQYKVDEKLIKNTYIEQIENNQNKRKVPGIGTYNLRRSFDENQQKIHKLKHIVQKSIQERFFYEDTQHMSARVPGAGNYSPHQSVQHIKPDKKSPKYWVDKHKKQGEKIHKRNLSMPTAGTYSPLYQSFTTFDKLNSTTKKQIKNGFGTDSRFTYTRPNKIVIKEARPSPDTYNMTMNWRGKQFALKGRQWNQVQWKGLSQSVYQK